MLSLSSEPNRFCTTDSSWLFIIRLFGCMNRRKLVSFVFIWSVRFFFLYAPAQQNTGYKRLIVAHVAWIESVASCIPSVPFRQWRRSAAPPNFTVCSIIYCVYLFILQIYVVEQRWSNPNSFQNIPYNNVLPKTIRWIQLFQRSLVTSVCSSFVQCFAICDIYEWHTHLRNLE